MGVIMVGPWMLSSQNGSDHGRHHGWAMDAFFLRRSRPWTSSWLVHEYSLLRREQTMDVIMFVPWTLSFNYGEETCYLDPGLGRSECKQKEP